jgi:hypothetical protein
VLNAQYPIRLSKDLAGEREGAMELITFGNVETNLVGAAMLTGFGVFFSGIVYLLMVYPSTRREEFRTYEGFSKRSGAIAGFSIFLTFAAGGYYTYLLSPFFGIELDHTQFNLLYRVPTRTVTLTREDIEQIVRHSQVTKGGTRVRLRIQTRSGQVYDSAQLKPRDFDVAFRKLAGWLAGDTLME